MLKKQRLFLAKFETGKHSSKIYFHFYCYSAIFIWINDINELNTFACFDDYFQNHEDNISIRLSASPYCLPCSWCLHFWRMRIDSCVLLLWQKVRIIIMHGLLVVRGAPNCPLPVSITNASQPEKMNINRRKNTGRENYNF